MDIAQYIGLFLLKNEYCYLPGIGSLTVAKKAAIYNSETQEMNPPVYEVIFSRSIGSIDDAFANFIANNERISIAHASNHFKDFCQRSKSELKEGREMIIPGIGRLLMDENQEITFEQDAHLQVKGKPIPFFRNSQNVDDKKKEEALTNIIKRTEIKEPKANEEIVMKAPQVNWPKIIVLILVVLAILAAIIYFISSNNKEGATADYPIENQETEQQSVPAPTNVSEPTPTSVTTTNPVVADSNGNIKYQVLINEYDTKERAEHRISQLQSYGNDVVLIEKDTNWFLVVININATASDTTRIVDSLKRVFNPNGKVHIVK